MRAISHRASWSSRSAAPLWAAALLLAACSGDYGPAIPQSTSGSTQTSSSKARDGGTGDAAMSFVLDASSRFAPDAFFINDPAPPMCGQDGKMTAAPKTDDSADCPEDKNREGCSCKQTNQT